MSKSGVMTIPEWHKEHQMLRQQARLSEKQLNAQFVRLRGQTPELVDLEGYEQTLRNRRKTESNSLRKDAAKTSLAVEKFADLIALSSFRGSPADYEKEVRRRANEIETLLATFKQKRREQYTQLSQKETTLIAELENVKSRMDAAEAESDLLSTNSSHRRTKRNHTSAGRLLAQAKASTTTNNTDNKSKEELSLQDHVAEIDALLEADGGVKGTWSDEDHAHFLKLYTQTPNKAKLVKLMSLRIPGVTLDMANQHVQRYHRTLVYERKKRQLISEWRENREQAKAEAVRQAQLAKTKQNDDAKRLAAVHAQEEARRKAALVKEWREVKAEQERTVTLLQREQDRLAEWRAEQSRKLNAQRSKQALEAHRAMLEEKRQAEAELDEETAALQADADRAQKERALAFKRRQRETLERLERKRILADQEKQRKRERKERQRKAVQPESVSLMQPSRARVTQPTKSALLREQQRRADRLSQPKSRTGRLSGNNTAHVNPVYISHTARATPSWRQNM